MVSCELRAGFLLRSEALSPSPEVSQKLWLKPPWKCWRKLKGKAVPCSCRWLTHFPTTWALFSGGVPKGSGRQLWCQVSEPLPHSTLPPNPVVSNNKLSPVLMNLQMVWRFCWSWLGSLYAYSQLWGRQAALLIVALFAAGCCTRMTSAGTTEPSSEWL